MAGGAPAEVKPLPAPDSPAEALDRITIPPDAMARIAEALTTGGSIIVSDQGINQRRNRRRHRLHRSAALGALAIVITRLVERLIAEIARCAMLRLD